jgi:hypothetical protein
MVGRGIARGFPGTWVGKDTVLWIRIRKNRMFLDLPDPDPSLFCPHTDPDLNPDHILPSENKKVRKTLISTIL